MLDEENEGLAEGTTLQSISRVGVDFFDSGVDVVDSYAVVLAVGRE